MAGEASATPGTGRSARSGRRGPSGGHRRLTEGPITRTLFLFSLPLLGGNVLQSLSASVNQFWVSHLLGVTAITAIGNANLIMMLLLGVIFGVSMAANILVGHAVGANDPSLVKKIMGTATCFFSVMSVSLALVGWMISPHILALMQTPASARAEAIIYLRIVFSAMPFMYFFAFLQMAQRGAGDSRTPFYFMVLAVVLDALLNPLLIAGIGPFPKLGIAGSASSTLIGQGVSLLAMVIYLYRRQTIILLRWSELHLLRPDSRILKSLVLRGLPMGAQMLIISMAAMVMIGFVNQHGPVTAAAFVGAQQVWNYIQMPGMAVGAAVSSMAAQNVGAGLWDRVDKIARSSIIVSVAVTGSVTALLYLLDPLPLYVFLPPGSPTIPIAQHINSMVLWAFIIMNATFCLMGVVRATGAVWPPTIFLFISMWLIRIPFTILLTPRFGTEAIWWSFPLGTLSSSFLSFLYYKYGGWRRSRMLEPEASGEVSDGALSPPVMDPHEEDDDEDVPLPAAVG